MKIRTMKSLGLATLLVACSSQDDSTQLLGLPAAAQAKLPASNQPRAPSPSALPASAAPSGPAFSWALPVAGVAVAVAATRLNIEHAARQHLAGATSGQRFTPARVAELELKDVHDTGRGPIIARFDRRIGGLEVFGQRVSVALSRGLQPLAASGDASGERTVISKATGRFADFLLSPEEAVLAAVRDVTGVTLTRSELGAPSAAAGEYERVALEATALGKLGVLPGTRSPRTKRVLFPSASKRLVPAYYVEVDSGRDHERQPRYYAHVVSAADGAVLWRRNLTAHADFTYRVYADDSGLYTPWDGPHGPEVTPYRGVGPVAGFSPPFAAPQPVTLSSLESIGITDPWLPDRARETVGNNVDAYLDISPDDGYTLGTDFRGQATRPGVFDAAFDPLVDANSTTRQQTAAVTQLFYNINWLHDWFYAAGFDETSGNAQRSNYERGGVEGDPLHAEAQDESGLNNANMGTPADGEAPVMQMYMWEYGPSSLTVTDADGVGVEYDATVPRYAPLKFDVQGPVVLADPVDGCEPLVGDYAGRIVLMDDTPEYDCGQEFGGSGVKMTNAQTAGAVGVIIANIATSFDPEVSDQGYDEPAIPITIGAVGIGLASGNQLRAALAEGQTPEAHLVSNVLLRDGDIDNQIVAHEWGHYISNRLIGNASGLGTQMSNGLGEGWADFHALLMTVRPEDANVPGNESWAGIYGLGGYAAAGFTSDSYYFGIRRYPYSTDLTKNPLMFRHISNDFALPADVTKSFDFDHTEVHNVGEVWANMLWECYASLLRDTEGPAPRLTFEAARDRMRDYLVASYKLTPNNPTLLEARDALFAAALATDPVDLERFGQAFARRGAGSFAVAPDRFDDTNSGIGESYVAGGALVNTSAALLDDVAPVCVADQFLDNGEVGSLLLTFRNVGITQSDVASATVVASLEGVTFPNGPTVDIPPLPMGGTAEVAVQVGLAGLDGITPIEFSVQVSDIGAGAPPPQTYAFAANADVLPQSSFTDTVDSPRGVWLSSSQSESPTPPRWERVALAVTEHIYHCKPPTMVSTVDLQSPAIAVDAGEPFQVTFRHRYEFESFQPDDEPALNFDGGIIELSTDAGATWTDVGTQVAGYTGTVFPEFDNPLAGHQAFVGSSPGYPEYATTELDFGTAYAGEQVLIRFRVATDTGMTAAGWDIDDIQVTGVGQPPFDAVVPQGDACSEPPLVTVIAP